MKMHKILIKMGINDPLHQFLETEVEIFLKLFLSAKTSSESFAGEHREKIWMRVAETSLVKSAEKGREIFWK